MCIIPRDCHQLNVLCGTDQVTPIRCFHGKKMLTIIFKTVVTQKKKCIEVYKSRSRGCAIVQVKSDYKILIYITSAEHQIRTLRILNHMYFHIDSKMSYFIKCILLRTSFDGGIKIACT